MPRIAGIDIPLDKAAGISLTYIFGIGKKTATDVLKAVDIPWDVKPRDLTEEEVSRIRKEIERKYRVEGDLRKEVNMSIKRLVEIGSYRGMRHKRKLPSRGQRTHTNARTLKGPRPSKALSRTNRQKPTLRLPGSNGRSFFDSAAGARSHAFYLT